jgi:glutamate/tyrosine decarboxylase-like PLP-dependent enzyme
MIAHLFNAPIKEEETAIGVATVGSSEAIMLAGLAFKRKWANKRKEEGKPYDKPNIVTGANVQVFLLFCVVKYFDFTTVCSRKMTLVTSHVCRFAGKNLLDILK